MKIASFNINNINRRLANLLRWLREAEPDIACLQELKAAATEFPADAIRQAGYHAVWHGEKRWNGVANSRASGPKRSGNDMASIQTKCRTLLRSAVTLTTNCAALPELDRNAPRNCCGDTTRLMVSSMQVSFKLRLRCSAFIG